MNLKRTAALLLAVLLGLMPLCGCTRTGGTDDGEDTTEAGEDLFGGDQTTAPDPETLVPFTFDAESDTYRAPNGTAYRVAPVCYEPTTVGGAYAACGVLTLYQIDGASPDEYLTEVYTGIGGIVVSDAVHLPTLGQMQPTLALVCIQEELTLAMGTVTDVDLLEKLIDCMENGRDVGEDTGTVQYEIKFANPAQYPAFYYRLTYYEKTDGTRCLYDRDSKKTVEIGDLLSDYIYTQEEYESAAESVAGQGG